MRPSRTPLSHAFVASAGLFFLGAAIAAQPLHVTVSGAVRGRMHEVALELLELDDVVYVSLSRITEEFGGAFNPMPSRVRIDLGGTTAWVGINDNRVNALSIFSLSYPVISAHDDILMAYNDLGAFFEKSFRILLEVPELSSFEESPAPEVDPSLLGIATLFPEDASQVSPRATTRPIQVIVIDPGHGGYDVGLVGGSGLIEKDLTLDIALRVEKALASRLGQTLFLTRREDIDLSPGQRVALMHNTKGDLVVSIHLGAAASPNTHGAAIFYAPTPGATLARADSYGEDRGAESARLAGMLRDSLSKATGSAVQGMYEANVRLLNRVPVPGVLVEIGNLSNPSDESLLALESYRDRVSAGIAEGIVAYVEQRMEPRHGLPRGLSFPN